MIELDRKVDSKAFYEAFEWMKKQDYSKAKVALDKGLALAVEQEDKTLEALFYSAFGVLCKLENNPQQAWKFYDKAEKILPENPALKINSAELLIENFAQFQSAFRKMEKILQTTDLDPVYKHQAHTLAGLAQLKKGEIELAVTHFKKSFEDSITDFLSVQQLNLKLLEAFLLKKVQTRACLDFLNKAQALAEKLRDERHIQLFEALIHQFSETKS